MKKLALLGASGSIGTQTIQVLEKLKDEFELVSFSVGKNIDYANELVKKFPTVKLICVQNKEDEDKVDFANVCSEIPGLIKVSTLPDVDIVLTAVVGSIGLLPTIEAIKNKKDIALANKETLVMAGHIIMPMAQQYGVKILPVDSEHSAIFQCLEGEEHQEIKNLIITASGGSFRNKSLDELENVTKEDALNHPNWSMGQKITIDSATMVNKGLEIIEAHHLFNVDYENIIPLIHYESIIHSMVEFADNVIMAQLGTSDMKAPISYALNYPHRKNVNVKRLDLKTLKSLNFKEVDMQRYEAVALAFEAGKKGHSFPTVYNAANEIAVDLFLKDKIKFIEITKIIKGQLASHEVVKNPTIEQVIEITNEVKKKVKGGI